MYTKDHNWQCTDASGPKVIQTNITAGILSLIDVEKDNMEVQCDGASLSLPIGLQFPKALEKDNTFACQQVSQNTPSFIFCWYTIVFLVSSPQT